VNNPVQHDPDRFFRTDTVRADIKGRTIRGGLVTALAQVVKQGLALVTVIILSRLLTPEDTGLFAMILVIIGFNNLISDLGLSVATIQRPDINQAQASALFWLNTLLGLGLSVLTALSAPLIAWFYGEPRLIEPTLVIAIIFLIGALSVQHRALLRRQMRFTPLAAIEIVSGVVSAIVGIVGALLGWSYWALVWMQFIIAPIQLIGSWITCPWKPDPPRPAQGVGAMVSFGMNLTGFRIVNYISRNLDNVLLGFFYGAVQLGLYTRAYSLLVLPLGRINEPLASVAIPALSRLANEPEQYRQAYRRIIGMLCVITMPLVACLIAASEWAVLVLLGPQWVEASLIFALLGISGFLEPFLYTFSWLFTSQARTKEQFNWGLAGTAVTVVAILAGLPWGAVGVAAAYGISGLLIRAPLSFWFAGRKGPVGIGYLYRIVLPFAMTSMAILAAVSFFRFSFPNLDPLLGLAGSGLITAGVTLAVLAALPAGRATLQDLRSMPANLLRRRKQTPPATQAADA
jgi:O-antigen/teichoic acid export membrane protein